MGYQAQGTQVLLQLSDVFIEAPSPMNPIARIARSILPVLVAGALLASALPCDAICTAMQSAAIDHAQADTGSSHCAKSDPAPRPPAGPPCEEDCAGCESPSIGVPSTFASTSGAFVHDHVAPPPATALVSLRETNAAEWARWSPPDPPPRDVLALTTTLLI